MFVQLISLIFIEELIIDCLELWLCCIVPRNRNTHNYSNLEVLKFLEVNIIEEEQLELIDSKGTLEIDIVMHDIVQLVQLSHLLLAEHAVASITHIKYDIISMKLFYFTECQLTIKDITELRLDLLDEAI